MQYIVLPPKKYSQVMLTNDIRDIPIVYQYRGILTEGARLPLIVLVKVGRKYYIIDGVHRALAYALEDEGIEAVVLTSQKEADIDVLIEAESYRYLVVNDILRKFMLKDISLKDLKIAAQKASKKEANNFDLKQLKAAFLEWEKDD